MGYSPWDCATSVFLALIGALAYVWFWARKWEDLKSFEAARTLALGAFAGFIYYFVRVDWNAPDFVITTMVGWFASDFLEAIAQKVKQILGIGKVLDEEK